MAWSNLAMSPAVYLWAGSGKWGLIGEILKSQETALAIKACQPWPPLSPWYQSVSEYLYAYISGYLHGAICAFFFLCACWSITKFIITAATQGLWMCSCARVSQSALMLSTLLSSGPQVQWGQSCSQVRINPSSWMWMRRRTWVSVFFLFFLFLLFQSGFLPKQKLLFYVFACIFVSLFPACMSSLICPPVSLWSVISVNAFYIFYTSIGVLCLHFMK